MNKSKRGQITLFIIIGLIILFTVILLVYIANVKIAFKPSKIVPEDVKPVRNLIESCIETNAMPLIEHMKTHSGYPDLTQFTLNLYYSDMKVPYTLPEDKEKMAELLYDNVKNKIKECIDFTKFPQFNIEEKKEFELTVKVNPEDVTLSLEYPIEIISKKNNKKTKLLDFKKVIPTKLGKLSDLARAITTKISLTPFYLEEMTLDIMRFNYNVNFPYEGMEFTTDKREWSIKNNLKPDLKERLWANLDCITYQGTASNVLPASCEDEPFYQKYSIPVTTNPIYRNTIVTTSNTFIPDWDFIEFSVSPSKGDKVKAINPMGKSFDPASLLIGKLIKLYHHRYNIKYPVLFTLYEGNEQFNFATTATIKNNKADRQAQFFPTSTIIIESEDFCEDKETTYTVEARDEQSFDLIKDIDIEFQCVQFSCNIGKTPLTEKFPFCYNGILIAKKENYMDVYKTITEDYQDGDVIDFEMTPLIKLDYYFDIEDGFIRPLEDDETIMVMISNTDKNYDKQFYYSNEMDKEQIELLLGDNDYDISIYLTKGDKLIGGYKEDNVNIEASSYYTKIIFNILADSTITTDQESADFWENIETQSLNYRPRLDFD